MQNPVRGSRGSCRVQRGNSKDRQSVMRRVNRRLRQITKRFIAQGGEGVLVADTGYWG